LSAIYLASLPISALLMQLWRKLLFNTVIQAKMLKIKMFNRELFGKINEFLTVKLDAIYR